MDFNAYDACFEGLDGSYHPVRTDFTLTSGPEAADRERYFKNDPDWSLETREKVRRHRFVVCLLGLSCMALGLMSRIMLNVAIVEMVDDGPPVELGTEPPPSWSDSASQPPPGWTVKLEVGTTFSPTEAQNSSEIAATTLLELATEAPTTAASVEPTQNGLVKFNWSVKEQNLLLASFYFGYAPAILLGGSLVPRFGSKYLLFLATAGTAFFNLLTPTIAQYSLGLLISSRVLLGLIQGSLMPAMYDLFNKWLTPTEISIFAPMIKVAMGLGCLFGNMVPGMAVAFGYNWPFMFYFGAGLSLAVSIAWLPLASTSPQDNRFVNEAELKRIMRKKRLSSVQVAGEEKSREQAKRAEGAPWLLIATNPSVLALTLAKFTYNVGVDIICLELAVYLKNIHQAPTETISAIASAGSLLQVLFIIPVGWAARLLVEKRALGLSKTKWRKIFQGGSNFSMGLCLLGLSQVGANLTLVSWLVTGVYLFWVLGAGGESMVPYDLSHKYPAAIVSLAHSISLSSSFVVPSVCGAILGETNAEPDRWNLIFLISSGALGLGGLVLVLVLKAKPFLPGEREPPADVKVSPPGGATKQQPSSV